MKEPNWDEAPKWANYFATDMDGRASWYSHAPTLVHGYYFYAEGRSTEYLPCVIPTIAERPAK